jgi:UDP-N-acetyl-D-mannosaminuronic acid dehydrogenase
MEIVHQLKELQIGELLVVEPHITELPTILVGSNVTFSEATDAVSKADIVLLLVNHQKFTDITVVQLAGKVVIDTCSLWNLV